MKKDDLYIFITKYELDTYIGTGNRTEFHTIIIQYSKTVVSEMGTVPLESLVYFFKIIH